MTDLKDTDSGVIRTGTRQAIKMGRRSIGGGVGEHCDDHEKRRHDNIGLCGLMSVYPGVDVRFPCPTFSQALFLNSGFAFRMTRAIKLEWPAIPDA